jgi:hypothetical protein
MEITVPKEQVAEFCRRNHIRRMAYFGSVLRRDFSRRSDIDVLVEFKRGHNPGLLGLVGMQMELARIHRRKVDLRTPDDLSKYIRGRIVRSARVQYVS